MSWQTILGAFLLTLVYGAIIAALAWLLRRAGVAAGRAVALGAVIFGLASGLLAAWAWPYDSCVLPNLWAVLLGDALYGWASSVLGNPALLRAPWIYPSAGVILYGVLGLVVQAIVNGRGARRLDGSKGHSIGDRCPAHRKGCPDWEYPGCDASPVQDLLPRRRRKHGRERQ